MLMTGAALGALAGPIMTGTGGASLGVGAGGVMGGLGAAKGTGLALGLDSLLKGGSGYGLSSLSRLLGTAGPIQGGLQSLGMLSQLTGIGGGQGVSRSATKAQAAVNKEQAKMLKYMRTKVYPFSLGLNKDLFRD